MNEEEVCRRCEGCGEIADDDEGTPWSYWRSLPLMSAGAVLAGIVRPLPCPECSVAPPSQDELLDAAIFEGKGIID